MVRRRFYWLLHLTFRSLCHQPWRAILIVASLTSAVLLVTVFTQFYYGVNREWSSRLSPYGANLIVRSRGAGLQLQFGTTNLSEADLLPGFRATASAYLVH